MNLNIHSVIDQRCVDIFLLSLLFRLLFVTFGTTKGISNSSVGGIFSLETELNDGNGSVGTGKGIPISTNRHGILTCLILHTNRRLLNVWLISRIVHVWMIHSKIRKEISLKNKILLTPNCIIVVGKKEKIESRETFERMHSYQWLIPLRDSLTLTWWEEWNDS